MIAILNRLFIVFLFICSLLVASCETGNDDDDNDVVEPKKINLSGVVAKGFAVAGADVFFIDANGVQINAGSTDNNGTFSSEVDLDDVTFPFIVMVGDSDDNLSSVIAPSEATINEMVNSEDALLVHVNPFTSLTNLQLLGELFADEWADDQNSIIAKLEGLDKDAYIQEGNRILELTLGGGVSFEKFYNDAEFKARIADGTQIPSLADVFLDTIGEIANENGKSIDEIIKEYLLAVNETGVQRTIGQTTTNTTFLQDPKFTVEVAANALTSGISKSEALKLFKEQVESDDAEDIFETMSEILDEIKTEVGTTNSKRLQACIDAITEVVQQVFTNEESVNTDFTVDEVKTTIKNTVTMAKDSIISTVDSVIQNSNLDDESINTIIKGTAQQVGTVVSMLNVSEKELTDEEIEASTSGIEDTASQVSGLLVNAVTESQADNTKTLDEAIQEKAQEFAQITDQNREKIVTEVSEVNEDAVKDEDLIEQIETPSVEVIETPDQPEEVTETVTDTDTETDTVDILPDLDERKAFINSLKSALDPYASNPDLAPSPRYSYSGLELTYNGDDSEGKIITDSDTISIKGTITNLEEGNVYNVNMELEPVSYNGKCCVYKANNSTFGLMLSLNIDFVQGENGVDFVPLALPENDPELTNTKARALFFTILSSESPIDYIWAIDK